VSRDFGKTWERAGLEGSLAKNFLMSVTFADSSHGWVAADNGTIAVTRNGGRSWKVEETNRTDMIRDIRVIGNKVVAVGDRLMILQRDVVEK
jgi:photosystem II stability/assembly factor-like uncharacterized protein